MTDQSRKASENSGFLDRVLQILQEISEKSADGDYLYRGEPEHYCRVSSSLYRKCGGIDAEYFDIGVVQNEIKQEAKSMIAQHYEDDDLLAQLRHYGYPTNLIDFTTDYLIALFFACDGEPDKDGRVILIKRHGNQLLEPKKPESRVIAQKSILVWPPKGYIEDNRTMTVPIPHELKEPMLDYLNSRHGLSATTLYNDIHGFIYYHQGHESAYLEFYAGVMFLNRGQYSKAIERFSNSIRLNPQLPAAYMNRGVAFAKRGDIERAIHDYDRAIELAPTAADLYTNRGDAYRQMGKFCLSIQDLDRAISLNPIDDKAYDNRGLAFRGKDNPNRAIEDFDRAIEINPANAVAHNNRGVVYRDLGKRDLALQDFERALELNPQFAGAYNNRGILYLNRGEYDWAIQEFDLALEVDPHFADAYYNRGTVFARQEKLDNAIEDFTKVIELNPGDAAAYTARGVAHWYKREFHLSIDDHNRAIELDPSLAMAYFYRSLCWLVSKEWKKAEADLSEAKRLGVDTVSDFREEFESVAAFEEQYDVKLPTRIVAMLTPEGDE